MDITETKAWLKHSPVNRIRTYTDSLNSWIHRVIVWDNREINNSWYFPSRPKLPGISCYGE